MRVCVCVSGFVSTFVTLGCSSGSSSCSDSSLPESPRIWLFVLQQPACGIGYVYTVEWSVCVWERERETYRGEREEMEGKGGATDWKQKRLSSLLSLFSFSHFEVLSSAAEILHKSHTHSCPTCVWPAWKRYSWFDNLFLLLLLLIITTAVKILRYLNSKKGLFFVLLCLFFGFSHFPPSARTFFCLECNYPAVAHVVMRSYCVFFVYFFFNIPPWERSRNQFHLYINWLNTMMYLKPPVIEEQSAHLSVRAAAAGSTRFHHVWPRSGLQNGLKNVNAQTACWL